MQIVTEISLNSLAQDIYWKVDKLKFLFDHYHYGPSIPRRWSNLGYYALYTSLVQCRHGNLRVQL